MRKQNIAAFPNETWSSERVKELTMRKINDSKAAGHSHTPRRARRGVASAAIAAALVLAFAGTAFAAWLFLKPSEVAERFGNSALSAAFDSDTAVNINKSVTSGDYTFTLLAVVSGGDVSGMPYFSADVRNDRTYAVVAIQNADGTPFEDYGDAKLFAPITGDGSGVSMAKRDESIENEIRVTNISPRFFVSPLVKGLKPWEVNAATMNGAYAESFVDGVLYRLVECDNVTMFADRGLYFAICTDAFISNGTFNFDEKSGEIGVNPDYSGASAVFDLPIDKSLADPEKAEQYLNSLFAPAADVTEDAPLPPEMIWAHSLDWEKAVPVASTVKELTVADNGEIIYSFEYDNGEGNAIAFFSDCFTDGGGAQSKIVRIDSSTDTEGNVSAFAIRFSLDENGVVTGSIVIPG